MSGNTWVSYLIGAVVGIVVGIFTGGVLGYTAYAATVGLLAFSVTSSYLLSRQSQGGDGLSGIKSAAAKEIEFTAASEAIPVPVVFGTSRVAGNMLRFDSDTFRSVPIYEKVESGGGGKGGGGGGGGEEKIVVGYKYYLSYIVGLCVGPIDRIGLIWDGNNMNQIGEGFASMDATQSVQISGKDYDGFIDFYRGDADQNYTGAYSFTPLYNTVKGNFRNVCVASFSDFFIGRSPVPRTMLFEISRYPKCLGVDGLPVPGLYTRGSTSNLGSAWREANPAAILWELFTNPIWGAGLDPALLDVPSFVQVSTYFAEANIGLSFTLDAQDVLSSTVDFIRQHVSTVVVWDAERLFCRCIMDTSNFVIAATINADQVNNVEFSRPAWPDVANELRVEFTNRGNGYKAEIAHIQDDAAITMCGGIINSQRVNLPGFQTRPLAEQQAQRILSEMSYPAGTLSFKMNRWAAHILPGDLIRFIWNEWSDDPVNTFWRVGEITDSEQSADGIRVMLIEDQYVTAYFGAPEPLEPALPGFDGDTFNDNDDLYLGEDHQLPMTFSDMQPVQAWQPNIFMTRGLELLLITAQQGSANVTGTAHYWSPAGITDFTYLGLTSGTAITGELLTAPPDDGVTNCRDDHQRFTLSINVEGTEGTMLGSANKVQLDTDSLEVLTNGYTDLLLIGNEIIQCGHIVETFPGVYEVRNYIRGAYGSTVENHAPGAPTAFIAAYSSALFMVDSTDLSTGDEIDFETYPTTIQGQHSTKYDWNLDEYLGLGKVPFAPEPLEHVVAGLDWTVKIRGRFHLIGAGVRPILKQDAGTLVIDIPFGYSYVMQAFNGGTATSDMIPCPVMLVPDDGVSETSGYLSFSYTAPAGTDRLKIWTMFDGETSLAPLLLTA